MHLVLFCIKFSSWHWLLSCMERMLCAASRSERAPARQRTLKRAAWAKHCSKNVRQVRRRTAGAAIGAGACAARAAAVAAARAAASAARAASCAACASACVPQKQSPGISTVLACQ